MSESEREIIHDKILDSCVKDTISPTETITSDQQQQPTEPTSSLPLAGLLVELFTESDSASSNTSERVSAPNSTKDIISFEIK